MVNEANAILGPLQFLKGEQLVVFSIQASKTYVVNLFDKIKDWADDTNHILTPNMRHLIISPNF